MNVSRAQGARLTAAISPRLVGRMAVFAAAVTVGLITYGAWVRVSGSGLGCPNWPLCDGASVPSDHAALIESGHRLFAGLDMIVVGLTAVLAFVRRRDFPGPARLLMASALFIVGQAVLGGVVVLTDLQSFVRLIHLAMAMGIIALLTIGGLGILRPAGGTRRGAWHLLLAGAGVIMVGGSIVATQSSFLCPDLPLCGESSSPMATGLHSIHRVLGVLVLLGMIVFALRLRRRGETGLLFKTTVGVAALLVAQICVGAATVALDLPNGLRILHVGIAATIWWGLMTVWVLSREAATARCAGEPPRRHGSRSPFPGG